VWFSPALLAAFREERLDYRSTFGGENPGSNLDPMVKTRVGKNLEASTGGATFGIISAVNKSRNTRLNHRARAHAARFHCDIKSRAHKPVVAKDARGFAKNDHFGVGRGVAITNRAVAGAREDPAIQNDHGADWNFTSNNRRASFGQCFPHEFNIGLHHRCENNTQEEEVMSTTGRNHAADCLTIMVRGNKLHAMRELLERLFQIDFIKGLAVTFRMQNPKEIVTEQYPLERPMVAERYRGAPRLNNNPETGETLCIGCNLCALACPENLIVVGWSRDDATRRKVLTHFTYDTSRCMFCGLCEDACPTDALELTQDFEMAYYTREGAIWDRHRLEQGPTPARYTR
jgi:NADH-quinone oxidoreductase subunit I